MSASGRVFERQSIQERMHDASFFSLAPVRRLEFGEDAVEVETWRRRERIPYTSIRADVVERHAAKSWRGGMSGYFPQVLVTLAGPERSYKLDVSPRFGDFKDGPELLALIRARVATTERKESLESAKKRDEARNWAWMGVLLVFVGILLWFFLQ